MSVASPRIDTVRDDNVRDDAEPGNLVFRVIGLLIVMLVPAFFWTSLIFAVGAIAGYSFSNPSLLSVGLGIATFLGVVCAPIMFRHTSF